MQQDEQSYSTTHLHAEPDATGHVLHPLQPSAELRAIFSTLTSFVVAATPSNGLFASLYDPERQLRTAVYAWTDGEEIDVSTLPPMPMTDSPHSRAVSTGQVILTDDFNAAMSGKPRVNVGLDRDPSLPASSIAVPIMAHGRVIGGFEAQSTQPAAYNQQHVSAMLTAANLAAIAIENMQLTEAERRLKTEAQESEQRLATIAEQLNRLLAQTELLNSIALSASGEYELERILSSTLEHLTSIITFTGGSIALVEGDNLVIRAAIGAFAETALGQSLPRGRGLSWRIVEECKPFVSGDLLAGGLRPTSPIRSYLAVPLVWRDAAFGLLQVDSVHVDAFQPEDLQLMQKVATALSGSVEIARRYAAEVQALSETERAVRLRDELLAVVSHDLKNPLAAIKGNTQLLRKRFMSLAPGDSTALLPGLERIDTATTKMIVLINELIDFANIQSGQALDLMRRPTDLVALARQAVKQHQQTTERHTLTVETSLSRLERVLDNLLSNAIKYSPEGGTITVGISQDASNVGVSTIPLDLDKATPTERVWAVLTVHDEGVGIPAADLPHIFEWYRRASNTSGKISGAGIGLASARHIVELHGGSIMANSEEGGGSTFTIRLPLTPELSPPRS
jgi:signal transduction histidine kinase